MAAFFLAFLITGLSWFTVMYLKGNGHVIKEFVDYQIRLFNTEDSDHGGPFFYHFIVLLLGCFPSSLFMILAHKKSSNDTPFQMHTKRWMMSLFWVVLILFSIVQTKIVHYSSLCYFPLTYLAAYSIQHLISNQFDWKKWFHVFFIVISTLIGLVFIIIGCVPLIKPWLINSNLIDDAFAIENLKADVHWSGYEWLIGVVFLSFTYFSLFKIKRRQLKYIYGLFLSSLFAVYFIILLIAPKVEQYSQRAAIEFYKACAKHHFTVETIGLKSYATLFYGELDPSLKTNESFNHYIDIRRNEFEASKINVNISYSLLHTYWTLDIASSQAACFVAKITDEKVVKEQCPQIKEVYRQNGFIFYTRILNWK